MRRTTVFLDEQLLRRARQLARSEGKSFAAVVRESLVAYVSRGRGPRLPSLTGQFASGSPDTSERVDDLLWPEPHD